MPNLFQILKNLLLPNNNNGNNNNNDADIITQLEMKIKELEQQLLQSTSNNNNSSNNNNTITLDNDKFYETLSELLLYIHDYELNLLKSDNSKENLLQELSNLDNILHDLKIQLQYRLSENPINLLFSKLFTELSQYSDDFNNIDDSDLFKYLTGQKFKQKQLLEFTQKIENILRGKNLDYSQYKALEELYKSFPLARRIVEIYTTSIVNRNPVNNDYLDIKPDKTKIQKKYPELPKSFIENYDLLSKQLLSILNRIRLFLNDYKLLKHKIVPKTCIYGTYFVEIINREEFVKQYYGADLLSYPLLTKLIKEDIITEEISQIKNNISKRKDITNSVNNLIATLLVDTTVMLDNNTNFTEENIYSNNNQININLDTTVLLEQDNNNNDNNKDRNNNNNDKLFAAIYNSLQNFKPENLSKLKILFHKPYNVIPIHDNNDTIYAYVIIDTELLTDNSIRDELLKQLSTIFSEVNVKQLSFSQAGAELLDILTDTFIENINKQLKKLIQNSPAPEIKDKLSIIANIFEKNIYNENSDINIKLKYAIYNFLLEFFTNKTLTKLKIRIVPPDNIVRFVFKETEFPYGKSVLSDIVLHSILYLISVYSNIVNRVSRSALYRVWRVNPTILKSKTSKLYRIIEYIKSKPITINDLADINKIPNIITAYRDVIQVIDPKTGSPAVDLSVQRIGDPTVRIQDIQEYKMDIAILSGIPSNRLGIQDNMELRESLVQSSIQFAELISEYQDMLSEQLKELFWKILKNSTPQLKNIPYNLFDFLDISIYKPIQLKLLQLESLFSAATNIISTLGQISQATNKQIDFIALLKEIIPNVDWDKITEHKITKDEEIKNIVNNTNQTPQQQNNSNPPSSPMF